MERRIYLVLRVDAWEAGVSASAVRAFTDPKRAVGFAERAEEIAVLLHRLRGTVMDENELKHKLDPGWPQAAWISPSRYSVRPVPLDEEAQPE